MCVGSNSGTVRIVFISNPCVEKERETTLWIHIISSIVLFNHYKITAKIYAFEET